MVKNSAKVEKKLGRTDMDTEGDDEPAGYGLRENPQKSWKFSGSDQEISGPENLCKKCGKVFDSKRALLCHARCHSDKQKKGIHCKECGVEFKSLRALSDHTECHPERFRVSNQSRSISSQKQFVESQYCVETSGLIRKNTSTGLSNTISTNPSSANQVESSSYVAELDQEVIGPENLCKKCGKVFDSKRALLCHVRCHSDKQKKGIHCKECGEEFKSLRALSDHTECHPERFRVSNQSRSISSQKQFVESQYCGETSGLIRKNTSTRLSNTISTNPSSANQVESSSYVAELDQEVIGPENLCKKCGKVFDSKRALLCHVRCHSDKQKKGIHCKECGEEFKSLRALSDHTECHPERFRVSNQSRSISSQKQFVESQYCGETSGLIRKNTSTRLSNTISTNPSSANQVESSSYVAELDQEVIEAAVTLLMLSKGIRHCDQHSSVTEFSKGVVNAFDEKKVSEFSENHSGFASDKEKAVKMEVSSERFYRGVSHKMPNLDDEPAFELGDTDMYKETVTYNEGKEYKCPVCFKDFASVQALGGHIRARSIKDS